MSTRQNLDKDKSYPMAPTIAFSNENLWALQMDPTLLPYCFERTSYKENLNNFFEIYKVVIHIYIIFIPLSIILCNLEF